MVTGVHYSCRVAGYENSEREVRMLLLVKTAEVEGGGDNGIKLELGGAEGF